MKNCEVGNYGMQYIYRVYQKKVDNFETALNLAQQLQVGSFLLI